MALFPLRKKQNAPKLLQVTGSQRVTPNMIRLTLRSDDLRDIPENADGGHFKLFLPETGQTKADFQAQLEKGPRPTTRTYTVRYARPNLGEIDVDFVAHGDEGPASAWAEAATDQSFCGFAGPGQPKLTEFRSDWYLLAADMSALPVASAGLEAMPMDAKGVAVFEITSPEDRQDIAAPPGIEQHWLIQSDPHVPSTAQCDLLRDMPWADGRVQTLIAGETWAVRDLRMLARGERGVDRKDCYASGYWRIGLREDEHQKVKREETDADERKLARVGA